MCSGFNPRFSVIVATMNAEDYIERTIESLSNQTFQDFEVLFIDGGSTDRTLEIISSYNKTKCRIVSESDSGISDAWNKGLLLASGDYILFLNAGDYYETGHLAIIAQAIRLSPYDCVVSSVRVSAAGGKLIDVRPNFNVSPIFGVGFLHPGCAVKRSIFEKIGGFSTKFQIAMDCDFIFRMRAAFPELMSGSVKSVVNMDGFGISNTRLYQAAGEYAQAMVDNGISEKFALIYLFRQILILSCRHVKNFFVRIFQRRVPHSG